MSNDLNNQIDAVRRDIVSMATKIEHAETKLEEYSRDAVNYGRWWNRLSDLQAKENKLHDKEYELLKQRTLLSSKFLLGPLCRCIFCDRSNFLFSNMIFPRFVCHPNARKKDSQSAWYEFVTFVVALLSNLPLFLSLTLTEGHAESAKIAKDYATTICFILSFVQYVVNRARIWYNWFRPDTRNRNSGLGQGGQPERTTAPGAFPTDDDMSSDDIDDSDTGESTHLNRRRK